jgi:nucleotide-binding universal stress UspA family protein
MIFDRILCGVDGSPAGDEALRQAAILRTPEGSVLAVVVSNPIEAIHAGFQASHAAAQITEDAERTAPVLLRLAQRERATLLAVGSHGSRRAVGIALGGIATTILHEAPCPVLVARSPRTPSRFPSSIVLGLDGSPASAAAAAAALALRERFGAAVRTVVADGGKGVDWESVRQIVGEVEPDPRPPVDALVAASQDGDLLLVGSRGLHGVRALGSVSERIAHQAGCSVLVVRPATREEP